MKSANIAGWYAAPGVPITHIYVDGFVMVVRITAEQREEMRQELSQWMFAMTIWNEFTVIVIEDPSAKAQDIDKINPVLMHYTQGFQDHRWQNANSLGLAFEMGSQALAVQVDK